MQITYSSAFTVEAKWFSLSFVGLGVFPKSAVLFERMKTVLVQVQPGMYERRMVKTGIENRSEIEILEGINEGEFIVSSGAYLINSEFILKKGGSVKHQH